MGVGGRVAAVHTGRGHRGREQAPTRPHGWTLRVGYRPTGGGPRRGAGRRPSWLVPRHAWPVAVVCLAGRGGVPDCLGWCLTARRHPWTIQRFPDHPQRSRTTGFPDYRGLPGAFADCRGSWTVVTRSVRFRRPHRRVLRRLPGSPRDSPGLPDAGPGQQPHAPPQQPPPPPPPAVGAGAPAPPPRPVTATVDNSFTVSAWPCGHEVGAEASRIGRLTSNVSPQARQRNS